MSEIRKMVFEMAICKSFSFELLWEIQLKGPKRLESNTISLLLILAQLYFLYSKGEFFFFMDNFVHKVCNLSLDLYVGLLLPGLDMCWEWKQGTANLFPSEQEVWYLFLLLLSVMCDAAGYSILLYLASTRRLVMLS